MKFYMVFAFLVFFFSLFSVESIKRKRSFRKPKEKNKGGGVDRKYLSKEKKKFKAQKPNKYKDSVLDKNDI